MLIRSFFLHQWQRLQQSLRCALLNNFQNLQTGLPNYSQPHQPTHADERFRWVMPAWGRVGVMGLLTVVLWSSMIHPAAARIDDDQFDGNIFALYAGNGSLVPPKQTIAESIAQGRPSLLVLYLEDSRDCKQFAATVSRLQASYGRVTSFIPINIDGLPLKGSGKPTDPATYNNGLVPRTVLFDAKGKVVFNEAGQVPFEAIDDRFREVFNLLPRSESEELVPRQPLNEVNVEVDL